jgi:hypothetical protein
MGLSTYLHGLFYLSYVFQYAMVEALQESLYEYGFSFFLFLFSICPYNVKILSHRTNAIVFLWFLKII